MVMVMVMAMFMTMMMVIVAVVVLVLTAMTIMNFLLVHVNSTINSASSHLAWEKLEPESYLKTKYIFIRKRNALHNFIRRQRHHAISHYNSNSGTVSDSKLARNKFENNLPTWKTWVYNHRKRENEKSRGIIAAKEAN